MASENTYPHGLKPGDFIQGVNHFGDIFFEVARCFAPSDHHNYWSIHYVTYDKYGSRPSEERMNSATAVRRVVPAEMAIPVMIQKGQRFEASFGQYDPFHGFAPVGTPLRQREDWNRPRG